MLKSVFYGESAGEETHLLPLVVLGRRLLVEEGILGQLLLKVHGVDGRLGGVQGAQQQIRHEGRMFYGEMLN